MIDQDIVLILPLIAAIGTAIALGGVAALSTLFPQGLVSKPSA